MSNATDHLAKARDYIAIAESQDSKREAYTKAADEIIAAQKDDPTLSFVEIDRALGRSEKSKGKYSGDLVRWRTSSAARTTLPFERDEKDTHEIRQQRDAEKVLADPEQRRQVIASLPADARASIAAEILQDAAVTDAAHDDTAFTAAVAGARSRIDAKRDQRHDERERLHRGIDEDELRFDRAKQAVRDGNYGDAERLLKGLPIDDERAGWLRKQADRHRYLADWFDAWADASPIQDADLADWLAG